MSVSKSGKMDFQQKHRHLIQMSPIVKNGTKAVYSCRHVVRHFIDGFLLLRCKHGDTVAVHTHKGLQHHPQVCLRLFR